MKAVVHKNVTLGKGCVIEDDVEIGRIGKVKKRTQKTIIGNNCHLRRGTIIYAGVTTGNNFATGHYALIREGNVIGDNVSVGSFTELGLRNKVGSGTRIHSRCFMEDVTLGKNVFVGPGVVFTNDPHPRSPEYERCFKGATVEDGAMIGGGVTLLPHVHIGKYALVGAGSVVASKVPARAVVVGNPSHKIKNIEDIICRRSERPHRPYARHARFS
jgi:acetyltransferase-like isoleucine patch superfamily enzyme